MHQTQSLTISLRLWHTKISGNIFFCTAALLLTNYSHRSAIKKCYTTDNRTVICKASVTMKFYKIIK